MNTYWFGAVTGWSEDIIMPKSHSVAELNFPSFF